MRASRNSKKSWGKKKPQAGEKTAQKKQVIKEKDYNEQNPVKAPQIAAPAAGAPDTASLAASEHPVATFDEEFVPPLDNEDSCVLLDALSAVRKQEQRLAAENKHSGSEKSQSEAPAAQGRTKKRVKPVTVKQTESAVQKDDGSSRRDRMYSKSSAHVSKAIKADLFGTSAGNFAALGIQKVCFKLLVSPFTCCAASMCVSR